jgi:hypothetical protein
MSKKLKAVTKWSNRANMTSKLTILPSSNVNVTNLERNSKRKKRSTRNSAKLTKKREQVTALQKVATTATTEKITTRKRKNTIEKIQTRYIH